MRAFSEDWGFGGRCLLATFPLIIHTAPTSCSTHSLRAARAGAEAARGDDAGQEGERALRPAGGEEEGAGGHGGPEDARAAAGGGGGGGGRGGGGAPGRAAVPAACALGGGGRERGQGDQGQGHAQGGLPGVKM